ncbi:Integrator complex subunit 3 [Perkinsus olseni]|uniref:Integrator complex subunit 3 n=2 Tax=Perkinsus olseni TaxID=32597 RepID=A0A7J6P8Q8_PEROL|nr:Integrator complex subunit 3 [Perkinsus olseni]
MSVSVSVGGVHGTAASSLHDTSSLLLHLRPGTISEAVGNVRESRLHQCVQIIKASDFGSRCSDKRYIGWVSSICRHQHDKDAVAAALCDIATQSISSGGSMDPHRCARVLKVIEDFTDKGNWIMDSPIILLQRCIRPGDFSSGMVHLTQSLLPFLHANTDAFISKKEVKLCQATFYKFATLLPCYIEYKDTSTVPTQDLATQCESLLTKFWDKSRPWIAAIGRDLIRVLLPISKCQGVSEIWYMLTSGDNTGRRLAKVCSLSTPYWLHRHLISPTEEEELSSLFTAFIAGSQKQMQDQYFERSFKQAEGLLLRHHVIHTTRAVLCGNLHNLDTEVSRNSMIPPQQRVFRWHFLGWLALIAGQFMTIEEQAYFRLSLFIDCLLGAVGDPIKTTPPSPSTHSSEDGGNSNSIVDEDTLVKSLVDGRDRLIPTSYREWDPHLPPPITPPPKGGKDKPTFLDGFMPVHDLIYEELPTERSVAVPLLVVLGLSIDNLLPSAASAKLTRLNLATSVSETLFQCAVETLRRGRDYSNDTLVGRVETLNVTARLPTSLKVCFDAVSKAIDELCSSREEYDTPEWLDKTPRAVLQRIILPDPAPPPLPAANNDDLEGPVMEDSWDEEGNYSEISDTEDDGTASVMTEAATFPEPTPAEQAPASEADQNRVQQPSVADGAIDQATTSNTSEMQNGDGKSPEDGNGADKSKGSKVMELLMLLQKGQQG